VSAASVVASAPIHSAWRMEIHAGRSASVSARTAGLLAPVAVFEADNIVLAEIAARLDLDDVQRLVADVLQAMHGADRDIGRLVLAQHDRVLVLRHPRLAAHHHPMLGALGMLLQGD